jgi:LAO/AO transport system kinase
MSSINPNFHFRKASEPSVSELMDGVLNQNLTALSKAITLVESGLSHHRRMANELIDGLLPHAGKSHRIGITGVPGVGKSTFIESFGLQLIERGHRVAVLAIDPTSSISHGSILGDKTRMNELAAHPNAFIRPTPSGGNLGGVHRKTRESILLCEAFGFDRIIVETVGVGQSETAVHHMTDVFLLLLLSGAGDELQGIKRGIMEMADLLVIHKADGENRVKAERAMAEVKSAIRLFPTPPSGWLPEVQTLSSIEKIGFDSLFQKLDRFFNHSMNKGFFDFNRKEQSLAWMKDALGDSLFFWLENQSDFHEKWKLQEEKVLLQQKSPFSAVSEILQNYLPQ